MAEGIQIFNETGALIFDSSDKVLKEVGNFNVSSSSTFDATAYGNAVNKLVAASNDDRGQTTSAPNYSVSGLQLSVSKANANQPMNANIRVMIF